MQQFTGKAISRFIAALLACLATSRIATAADTATVDFTRDVRPILADKCFKCHGPDADARETDLRLDNRANATRDRDGHVAIKPGDPEKSELVRRITSSDPSEQMPPPDSKKTLSAAEIELLRRWIAEGARWSIHWAFTAPTLPDVPAVSRPEWVRHPIDAFILARLQSEQISPSPEADATTLVRRLYLDLIGLPPTPEEVDDWVARLTTDDVAYAQLVEHLLASPHYGERWGQRWLDAARYADSDGFEKDKPRFVWFYRDWVIDALNRDLPYNEFLVEQIAGDQLPDATQDQRVATGFLRNSMTNEEGGIDPEQFRMEAMFDRMDAIGKGMLGVTIQCAQCHTHKFDPLTQEEYYRMFAFLNNCDEANATVYTPDEQAQRAAIFQQIRAIEDDLKHKTADWTERLAKWEQSVRGDQPEWTVVRPEDDATGGQKHYVLADASILAAGYAPTKHETTFTAKTDARRITAVRLELLNDSTLPRGGPGRSILGTCALTEFKLSAAPADDPGKTAAVKIVSASADVNPAEAPLKAIYDDRTDKRRVTGPIAFAVDGNDDTAWTIDVGPGLTNVPRKAVFVLEKPVEFPAGAVLTFTLRQMHGGWNSDDNQNNNLGRFRFAVTAADGVQADPLPAAVRAIVAILPDQRSPAQRDAVFSHWRTTVPEWKEANAAIEALWQQHPPGTTQLVLQTRDMPRTTALLARGDFLKPTKPVEPGVPAFLHPLPENAPPTRLTFARWLADERSPTTARALVNRVWQAYFGRGIVATSEDFGVQSEAPSHPELLDWLAVRFMQNGWKMKDLHRWIVTSSTYRQASLARPDLSTRDPENRLLARFPRQRVDGEIVRDVALTVSGQLNPTIGGPSVYPPAPDFLFQPPASYGPKTWKEETGPNRYRRSMYAFKFRSVPFPVLQNFDVPNADTSCVRRARSNTPLQALTTLNEPLFVECARAFAIRTLHEGGDTDAARLASAFRRCVARRPSDVELSDLQTLLNEQKKRFADDAAKAWQLAANDPKQPPALPAGATAADAAAWTVVARVLLNLDETITKE
ncbi:MAG: PSD1 and planctomycete cytochrome C domain-containing protein [Planctomycetaceae bacterium]